MKKLSIIVLFLIFFLSLLLRLWHLGKNPTFISDEASIGYNGYSILRTAKDEWGNFLPLSFKSFGEYKLPVYIYFVTPSIAIFGLNEFATRFPSALFGALAVLLVFFLAKELLSENKKLISSSIPFLASFLLAISPWHIQVSRMALEANLSLFVTILAALLLLKTKTNFKFYYLSFFLFALTFYTYNSSRLFTPLFLFFYFLIQRQNVSFKSILRPAVFGLLLLLPIIFSGFVGSRERFYKVGIFTDPGIIAQINEKRGQCQLKTSKTLCILRYNKPVVYTQTFIANYVSHFSWKFLFSSGSGLAQYGIPGHGQLYFWELPFLLVGLIYWFKQRKSLWLLSSWFLMAPLANSLTGLAHPVRAILMLPIFQIFVSSGIVLSFVFFSKRAYFRYVYSFLLFLVALTSLVSFLIRYFLYYPLVSNWNWQMGYRELYSKLARIEQSYDKIYVSKFYGEPHIFFLFYHQFNPEKYQQSKDVIRYDREDKWVNVDRIGKYYFVQEPTNVFLEERELMVISPQQLAFSGQEVGKVKYKDGQVAFLILEK